jgi:hypothetical protein
VAKLLQHSFTLMSDEINRRARRATAGGDYVFATRRVSEVENQAVKKEKE